MKKLFRMFFAVGLLAFLAVSMSACGGGDDNVVVAKPGAPTGVLATFNSPATISWTPVSGATSYNIYYSTDPEFTLTTGTKIPAGTTNPYTIADGILDDDTTYYFVVTAVNAGGESVASETVSARHHTFTQADLVGSWYVTLFYTGSDEGWLRMKLTIEDDSGDATLTYLEDPTGVIGGPYDPLHYDIDADGIVTQTSDYPGNTSYNVMASNTDLIIGTDSLDGNVRVIRIFQRAEPEDSVDSEVLYNTSFAFHELSSINASWMYGVGSVNGSGVASLGDVYDPAGLVDPTLLPDQELEVDSNGEVTIADDDSNFRGFLSGSGNLIVGTATDTETGSYQLRIIQRTDPAVTFTKGDLAGAYKMASLFDGDSAFWQRGTATINSSGTTQLTLEQSVLGVLDIDPITLDISTAGMIIALGDGSFHGTMSYTKDLLVSTLTLVEDTGDSYGLSLAVK